MRNILLTIEYDGTGFSGWQRQPGKRTVCGTLEEALSAVTGLDVKIDGTSRTDAGVHALGQRASFLLPDRGIPAERIPRAVNDRLAAMCGEAGADVRVVAAEEVPEGFHARFSSRGKRYIYRVLCGAEPSAFARTRFCQIEGTLDAEAMREAAAHLVGEHDFAAFRSSGGNPVNSTVREIYEIKIEGLPAEGFGIRSAQGGAGALRDGADGAAGLSAPRELRISVSGSGFLYNMVRIISGTLIEAGLGKRTPGSVLEALRSGERARAGFTAPAQGLYLDEVFFGDRKGGASRAEDPQDGGSL
jgi:tRNA pseudouridine38-40 synthase